LNQIKSLGDCDVHMELLDFYLLIYIVVDVGFSPLFWFPV